MKKTFIVGLLLTFSYCSTSNLANANQENWCLGKANLIKSKTINSKFRSSTPEGTKAEVSENYSYFVTALDVLDERIRESNEEFVSVNQIFGVMPDGVWAEHIEDWMQNYIYLLNGDGEEYEYASQLCKIWEEMSY